MADLVTLSDVLSHLNISSADPELELFIDAATDHVTDRYGTLPSASYTEALAVTDDGSGTYRHWLRPLHSPVTAVTSATNETGTAYTTGFTISTDGRAVRHASVTSGEWTLAYTAGHAITADLKLAVLEDIRGLYQPGQIGPPAAFGAFGTESTDTGPTYRPVRMWPRIDAWIDARTPPGIA